MDTLTIRKLADRSEGERIRVPEMKTVLLDDGTPVQVPTGFVKLVNPATPGDAHEPWPFDGIRVENKGGPPGTCRVPMSFVEKAVAEGWATLEGERIVRRPAGPPTDRWSSHHNLVNGDAFVLHTVDGDVRYRVTHQPDKYAIEGDDDTPVTGEIYDDGATRVDWFFELELESVRDSDG